MPRDSLCAHQIKLINLAPKRCKGISLIWFATCMQIEVTIEATKQIKML